MRASLLALMAGAAVIGLQVGAQKLGAKALQIPLVARLHERAERFPAAALFSPTRVSQVEESRAIPERELHAVVREHIELDPELHLPSPVVALVEQGDVLYAGTFDEGLFRIEAGAVNTVAIDPRVNDLALDSRGVLIAATAGGAWEVLADGNTDRFATGSFSAVAEWRGQTWLASRSGISVREEHGVWTRGREQGFAADLPDALAACGDKLCIGASDGLWLFDGLRMTHSSSVDGALPADWVTAVAHGRRSIWAGTFDGGLAQLGGPAQLRSKPRILSALPERRIASHALTVIGGEAFAGTPRGLLVVGARDAALVSEGALSAGVTAVIPAAAGGLWIGCLGSVERIELVAPGAEAAAQASAP